MQSVIGGHLDRFQFNSICCQVHIAGISIDYNRLYIPVLTYPTIGALFEHGLGLVMCFDAKMVWIT